MDQEEMQRFVHYMTENLLPFVPLERLETHRRVTDVLDQLPVVSEEELERTGNKESACSICIQPFLSILAEEEAAGAVESPAVFSGELGVTRLNQPWQCGHLFCRRDITKWIRTGNLTCPMCRKSLIEPRSQAEGEQSQESELPEPSPNVNIDRQRIMAEFEAEFFRVHNQRRGEESSESRDDFGGMYS